MGAQGSVLGEVAVGSQRAVNLVGAHLVEAFAWLPGRVSGSVLARNPSTAGSVEQVLRAEYVGFKEQLRGLYAAVNVALGGKVNHIVNVVIGKKAVGQLTVAYVSVHENTPTAVHIVLYCAVIAGVCKQVEHYYLDVFILVFLVEKVFYEVGADKSGCPCHQISFHIIDY